VGKKLKNLIWLGLVISVFVFPQPAFSYHQKQVLGEEDSVVSQLPQPAEGPGLILPDSPLFFLDTVKQNVRLLLAFSEEEKARVYNLIAGERFAESHAMLAKDNKTEAENSLKRMEEEFNKASVYLEKAKLKGRNVFGVAKEINDNIKEKYKVLDELSVNTEGPFGIRVEAVNEGILRAKVRVEDHLPQQELEHELEDHLKRKIDHRLHKASKSVEELEEELRMLDKHASEAARKSIAKEEDALRKELRNKDEQQRKEAEKRLEKERKRLERLLKLKEKAAKEARRALEKSHEAAEAYREAHELISQIENGEELDEEFDEDEFEDEFEDEEIDEDIDEGIEDLQDLESPPIMRK